MQISFHTITVIIQGHIYEGLTQKVIDSVRLFLPQSYIILSTCDSKPLNEVQSYDLLIQSPDPGGFAYPHHPSEKLNNINRQIVNTLTPLKKVNTPYVLKLRSDFVLSGNKFLEYFEQYTDYEDKYRVFGHKIMACCYFTRNPQSTLPYPFHPSDLIFFGRIDDLLKLYDIPLMLKEEAYWNPEKPHPYKYVPEQHIFIQCLRKNGFAVDCEYYNDCRPANIEQTERYFASNFIFLSFDQFNVMCEKYTFQPRMHPKDFLCCYTHYDWLCLYKKYVDDSTPLPPSDTEREALLRMLKVYKRYHLLANILALPIAFHKQAAWKLRRWLMSLFLRTTKES